MCYNIDFAEHFKENFVKIFELFPKTCNVLNMQTLFKRKSLKGILSKFVKNYFYYAFRAKYHTNY